LADFNLRLQMLGHEIAEPRFQRTIQDHAHKLGGLIMAVLVQ
jgi:hypothetical protein